jgi:hypothetical protein
MSKSLQTNVSEMATKERYRDEPVEEADTNATDTRSVFLKAQEEPQEDFCNC